MVSKITRSIIFYFLLSSVCLQAQSTLEVLDPQQGWPRYKGTIEEATFSVIPNGLFSQVSAYLTFSSRGTNFNLSAQLEVVMNFDLPEGSYVTDLWLWIGDNISKGVLLDTWTASSIYEGIVNRKQDPAIFRKTRTNHYELRVYPLKPNETRKVRITYHVPNIWYSNQISIPLQFSLLTPSLNKANKVSLVTWNNDEWKNPRCSETNLIFTTQTDTFFGVHQRLNLDSYNSSYPTQLIFNNPMINGVYLKLFKKSSEGFYQLSMFPATSISIASKKVLFMIDYDSRKSTTNRKQVLDELKQYIKGSFSTSDYFNLFYSSLSIGKVANDWIKADSINIETAFSKILENSISTYSNLPTLLKEGYEFIINKRGGNVFLISNSDQLGSNLTANQLITDLKKILTITVPTYILDFNDKDYTYYYFNSRSYIGNEYFYDNLSKFTSGSYSRISSGFSSTLSNLGNRLSGSINSFDLYTTLQNGFCFSRQTLSNSGLTISLNSAITQVGKYIGEFPFLIKTSGVYNSNPFTQTIVVEDVSNKMGDVSIEKMWVSTYLNSLEKSTITNSVINEIINLSKESRILSRYTAFLSLENDSTYCKDCYKDNPITTDVKIKDEIPTEFSINAYPNPFNPQTTITIQIPQNMKKENLSFKIYNILGELVKTFTQEEVGTGNIIRLLWNGVDQLGNKVSSGVYIFTVSGNNFVRSLKLMLMK